jgi:hypothetical protein
MKFFNLRVSCLKCWILILSLILSGCGTYTPLPTHGGGKRFAIEQILVSSVAKQAIDDIPLEILQGKKITLDLSIIPDEGGGYLNGGRPYLPETLSNIIQNQTTTYSDDKSRIKDSQFGFSASRNDSTYVKDLTINNTDSRQFNSLLISKLFRNNISVNPELESNENVDFSVEIIVDVFGTIRSRTDWLLKNTESLKAVISLEYVITPVSDKVLNKRSIGKVSYEAVYNEKYFVWLGPTSTSIKLVKTNLADSVPLLGNGVQSFENLKHRSPIKDMIPERAVQPLQITPNR